MQPLTIRKHWLAASKFQPSREFNWKWAFISSKSRQEVPGRAYLSTISGTSLLRREEVATLRRTFQQNQELSSNNIPSCIGEFSFSGPVTGLSSEGSYLEKTGRNTEPLPLWECLLFMKLTEESVLVSEGIQRFPELKIIIKCIWMF